MELSTTQIGRRLSAALGLLGACIALSPAGAQTRPNPKYTVAQAQKIALKKYPGKLVAKTELENEEGKWQYAVMIRSGKTLREVMVNAMTGKIDHAEVTTEAKEAAEKKADAAAAKNGKKKSAKPEKEKEEKEEKEKGGK